MDKAKKKKIKRIIMLAGAAAVVLLLALLPLILKNEETTDGPVASILSGTAQLGTVENKVIGGGTLAEDEAIEVSLPSSVKITGFLVSNGDSVSEGDAIAAVDRVTVMTAISEVQETLDEISERIEEESTTEADEEFTALAGGIVKQLYAEEGASVSDVMLEHGSLAVLSLDGLMAVDVTTESTLAAGESVTLTLSDGTAVTGEVASNLKGQMTVTVEDDDYAVGETVSISAADGSGIGTGVLYIYSPWSATAYAGTIDEVNISEGDKVDAGECIMKLSDIGYSAAYQQLLNQRQKYEDLMIELFEMYQTENVTAPCDGVVSGIDEDSAQLLAADSQGYSVSLLANAPNGDDETLYTNVIGKVSAIGQNGWAVCLNQQSTEIADYKLLSGVSLDTSAMTKLAIFDPNAIAGAPTPIYELAAGEWSMLSAGDISVGDILLFAGDSSGDFVWIVRLQKATDSSQQGDRQETQQPGDNNQETQQPGDSNQQDQSDIQQAGQDQQTQNNSALPQQDTSGIDISGLYGNISGADTEEEEELYSLDTTVIAAVTPQNNITLDITVSELDISSLSVGMKAEIMIDALGGEKTEAFITDISNTGTNDGGYSSFTVELTMNRGEDMLVGMNATATLVTSSAENVLTVPLEALVEDGSRTVIYTGYDESEGELINPVEVTVGRSDGSNAEVTAGLSENETYYYAYYDTLVISNEAELSGGGFNLFSMGR